MQLATSCLLPLGYKYIPAPPAFPPCCVHRPAIMKQLVDAVLNQNFDANCTSVCATVYGEEGSGKSTLMNALCHQRDIEKYFKDGFLFIHLGTPPDTCTKLSQLYNLLTNEEGAGDMHIIISQLRQVTGHHFCYLLVIIEDALDITDVDPYLQAFSSCKVVVTGRDSTLSRYITSSTEILVSEMEREEAVSMLQNGIVDIPIKVPEEVTKCCDKLVDDLHLWPLYLYLVRGQIMHHVKFQKMQFAEALKMVTQKLSNCGLGIYADDKQRHDRKHAEKPCIECTIKILDDTEKNCLLSVIFYAGAGCPLSKLVVEKLWEISKVNTSRIFTKLENSSVLICSDIYTAPFNVKQTCVQVHPVLAQYILNKTDPLKVIQLWPLKMLMLPLIQDELRLSFPQYSEEDQSDDEEYLKQTCKRIDHKWLAENVMYLTRSAFYDPHFIMYQLKFLKIHIRDRSDLVPNDKVQLIMDECLQILHELPGKLSRFNKQVDRLLYENDHDGLIELFTQTCTDNSVAKAAEKCLRLLESVSEFCHNVILQWINDTMEQLKLLLSEYSENALLILPQAKLYIELRKEITVALVTDKTKWKKLSDYVKTELKEHLAAIERQCKVKTQEISLKHIHQKLMH